ncbi:unnamed protein product [Rotaria magnacalcarata]|uniref:Uncharacterized protein n=3 Tax=Rotaria magnacalcarata TaxID=392030 RepID=A0A816G010_9BILA|nr:unnamed protein product [Rotaria magnacalcarata]CAF1668378.1 unnamed protein product [Rotaria magnacalcarata]CAF2058452.1 unnamed protein product [Rotaria magnacalcarata]CAF2132483.1 unnamed protein product [Rotaria magnacalcarata]CAF3769624.1 unnamed protein product [Rotaria magnacalcarata]
MLSTYTFLSDHSYSLRPVTDENDELPLNQREEKTKKRHKSSNRTNGTISTTNRTVSIDRSSSDKENNSIILLNLNNTSTSTTTNTSRTKNKSSANKRTSIGSRRTRVSTRTLVTDSRSESTKKQDSKISSKTAIKSTVGNIIKKKKENNRDKIKPLNVSQMGSSDLLPSLSIEERVKLRRTKPLQPPATIIEKVKSTKITKTKASCSPVIKKSNKKETPSSVSKLQNKKSFLGSGLDLNNIVLGNRQRRCVQT